ncbi:MAG TPA: hypothetical protein PK347_06430 [Burkholderiaceae bacterium]|nr:hypothetical protein [Burkholderiaceae bacterium]
MKLTAGLRLTDAWQQCQRHVHHLNHALHALSPMLPVSASALTGLSDEQVQDWDQFILRFTKLQDAMGSRLFPAVLTYLQEPFEDRPMLDKLHRLEKLGYLSSVQSWQNWRAIRNSFAHDYPEDNALKAGYLNLATDIVPELLDTLDRIAPIVDAANA